MGASECVAKEKVVAPDLGAIICCWGKLRSEAQVLSGGRAVCAARRRKTGVDRTAGSFGSVASDPSIPMLYLILEWIPFG